MAASCEIAADVYPAARWRSQYRSQYRNAARTVARGLRARRRETQAGRRTACIPRRARRSTHERRPGSGRRREQAARAVGPLWLAALLGGAWSCRQHTCKPPPFGCFRHAADFGQPTERVADVPRGGHSASLTGGYSARATFADRHLAQFSARCDRSAVPTANDAEVSLRGQPDTRGRPLRAAITTDHYHRREQRRGVFLARG